MKGNRLFLGLLLGVSGSIGIAVPAIAQLNLIPDKEPGRSLGTQIEALNGQTDLITGGSRPLNSANVFHSFQEFNVREGRTVYFNAPAGVLNVFSRVTGRNPSGILGRLGTVRRQGNQLFVSGANLFLINPNGILFGPNASLDVDRSFVATTADAIGFGDRGSFSAINPTNAVSLLTIAPSVYLFNQIPTGTIVNRSVANDVGLRVPNGRSLTLLGGDVSLTGGQLNAWGGRVEVGAVAEPGQVELLPSGALGFAAELARGTVALTDGARVNVSLNNGGEIGITAGDIRLAESQLVAGITRSGGTASSRAGDVRLDATGTIAVEEGSRIQNDLNAGFTGTAGNIVMTAGELRMTGGAQLSASTRGQGHAGNVVIQVRGLVLFQGLRADGLIPSGAFSNVEKTGTGQGGNIEISAGRLEVRDGAQLVVTTRGQGDAGKVVIQVRDLALFQGLSVDGRLGSGLFSSVEATGRGQGGNVEITAGRLEVRDGAQLVTSTEGQGDAGNVVIQVSDLALFKNGDANSSVKRAGRGQGGNIEIAAGRLEVSDDAQLIASTYGEGNAGNVVIQVSDLALFKNGNAGSSIERAGRGQGGNIEIAAGRLEVSDGAQLIASTRGEGNAGNVVIQVSDLALFQGRSADSQSPSGASSSVEATGRGQGGNVEIVASRLEVRDGAQLVASTEGQGDAGNVVIQVSDLALFQGRSAAFSSVERAGQGQGGNVEITAGRLEVRGRAGLSARALGQGNGGDIVLRIRDTLQVTDSLITTTSQFTFGGNINITANAIRLSGDGDILTAVFRGAGSGGNIDITANSILALGDSDILSFVQDGRGGNITLNARAFFGRNYRPATFGTDPDTLEGNDRVDVNASGTLANGTIITPNTSFIQNSLSQLPTNGIDTNKLLSQTCIIRKDQPQGTFYITGIDNIPNRPNDPAPSDYPTTPKSWQLGDPIAEPQGFYKLTDGRLVMSHKCKPTEKSN